MRLDRLVCLLVFIALAAGCKKKLPAVSVTPPPVESPPVPLTAALRPTYELAGRQIIAGTGFVIADRAGRNYFLTAAHVIEPTQNWRKMDRVSLHTLGSTGDPIGTGLPSTIVHVGISFDKAGADADLVIWETTFPQPPTVLRLAATDAKKNEWVWAVGQEMSRRGGQRLLRCKVTGTESEGITLEQHDTFKLQGFSGAPIVNLKGEVVGMILGGREPTVLCSTASTIRQRLSEARIEYP